MRVVWRCHSGGWGRAHRAAAVLRRWPRRGDDLTIAQFPHVAAPVARLGLAMGDALDLTLAACDLLVIDGPCPAWYVEEARQNGARLAQIVRHLDTPADIPDALTLAVEREAAGAGDPLWPLVLLDPDECLDRGTARADLGIFDDRPLVLVVESRLRQPVTLAPYVRGAVGERAQVVTLPVDRYPAQRWLAAADLVVGAAGGRLRDELEAAGVPHLLVALGPDQRARQTVDLARLGAALHRYPRTGCRVAVRLPNRAGIAAARLAAYAAG